ncbi:MAG: protein translocase subunit SecD [Candidatus Gracilibacteria bacterium]|nr:protein translocase subunit SecD [Candidatus Gracilibacteria bacterium]
MEKRFFNLVIIVFIAAFSLFYTIPWASFGITMPFTGNIYKLGLDLQGGVELDYKVDLDKVRADKDNNKQKEDSIVEGLKSIVDKRIESLNISDSVITTADYGTEKHIIVQIPLKGKDTTEDNANIKRAKDAIGKVVKIEFKEKRTSELTDADYKARKDIVRSALEELKISKYNFFVTANKYKDDNENVQAGTMSGTIDKLKETIDLSKIDAKTGLVDQLIVGTGSASFAMGSDGKISQKSGEKTYYAIQISNIDAKTKIYTINYLAVGSAPSEWIIAKDAKGRSLDDRYFTKSSVQYNQAFQPMVELTFNSIGADIFGELSTRLVGKQIAIFVGGQMLTAPNVNEPIRDGKAVITGNYTPDEAKKLADDINTGVIPAPIYLTSEKSIDAKLGMNSLQNLIYAGIIGFTLIFIFLVFTYSWSGVLAAVALLIYTAMLLVLVKMSGSVLTLASIAGIILTIGMAIDANVLIFERVKEELRKKTPIKKAVEIGFEHSWSAIWDSHITGIIIAIILFIFGINMIKGFGLMLGIGLVVSLFSAMWISRIFVILIANKKGISNKAFVGLKDKE